jgi:glycosyltransferase involved in cell wall biosynthesis
MRLLIWSDAAQTGFGRVGRELARRFIEAGVDCRALAINWRGRDGELMAFMRQPRDANQVGQFLADFDSDPLNARMVPAGAMNDAMGHNLIPSIMDGSLFTDGWTPEAVFSVADPRAMSDRLTRNKRLLERVPVWNYVPIEGANLPPCWNTIWQHVQPIAMSEFGKRELQSLLGRPIESVPHGLSAGFWPISPQRPGALRDKALRTKDDAKRAMDLEGRLVFLRTDRLVPRKNYPALFRALAPVLAEDPSRILVIHCSPVDEGGLMAEFVSQVAGSFGVNDVWRHPQVRFTGGHDTFRGYSDEEMNVLYNAADVYVSPTGSEGFGLTLLEAAACGVPVVTTDYGAGPEAVGAGAVLVPPAAYVTNSSAHDWALVSEPLFTEAVQRLADSPAERLRLGQLGAEHAKGFSWDTAASRILSLMH